MVQPTQPTNPLSPEDKEALDIALAECDNCRAMINRAKQAGLDVSSLEAQLDNAEQTARGIRQAFFPNE